MSDPTKPTQSGANRTGIATSPIDGREMVQGAKAGTPPPAPDAPALLAARVSYAEQAPPVGTMPIPTSFKSLAEATAQMLRGKKPMVLLDLLGERLAFERTGTRLYEGLLVKLEAADPHPGGPTREDLERIRDEELEHFALLKKAMGALGADQRGRRRGRQRRSGPGDRRSALHADRIAEGGVDGGAGRQ
jgi:hypothetical protein